MSGRWQHYLPASIIGGFGACRRSERLRDRLVVVRRLATGQIYKAKASEVAAAIDTYRLSNAPPGIDRDFIDHLWDAIEPKLPGMVSRLDARALDVTDADSWMYYSATVFVRNRELFGAAMGRANYGRGVPGPTRDELLLVTPAAIRKFSRQASELRWRVLHSPLDACPFLITDLGFASITDSVYLRKCFWLPIGPHVGLLGYPDDPRLPPRRPPLSEHLTLTPKSARWFAATAFPNGRADRSRTVHATVACGHPDDEQMLIDAIGTTRLPPLTTGPYQSRRRRTNSLID